ncbi:MAG: EF-P lysine aminoacylase EpmA [Woeseiaceae bacterium]
MTWRPNSSPAVATVRAAMLRRARQFFAERKVLEVETPALAAQATMDPNIASIRATVSDQPVYLGTSPEYHMKRLLAAGYPDIYQVARVFRDRESGRFHLPEFTMAEWYRLGFGLEEMIRESVDFVADMLADRVDAKLAVSVRYTTAFEDALGIDPLSASIGSIAAKLDTDDNLVDVLGNDRDAWLDLAMATGVAPTFDEKRLTVVHHYPASQAALARRCPDNPAFADRFEIYFGRLELANGFVELTDAGEQKERFQNDQIIRREKNLAMYDIDENFIAALDYGIPPCAGVAIGLDRLLMIACNTDDIHDVTAFTPGR